VRPDAHALGLVVEVEASAADYSTRLLDRHRLVGLHALFLREDMQDLGRQRHRAAAALARLGRLRIGVALDLHVTLEIAMLAVPRDAAAEPKARAASL